MYCFYFFKAGICWHAVIAQSFVKIFLGNDAAALSSAACRKGRKRIKRTITAYSRNKKQE